MIDIDNWIDRFENLRYILVMQGYDTISDWYNERDLTELLVLFHSMKEIEEKIKNEN